MNPSELPLTEVAAHIRRGDLSAVEYATALLERVEDHAHLNAFITVDADALLSAAKNADQAQAGGEPLGVLHGVPIAVKDNIDTVDLPTTGGTPALRTHRPAADADAVRLLRQAGALVLGKTNLHELAYGVTSGNGAFGPVANPYDTGRIAGGSSGGTAAAVAARLAAAGLGTDTGGSVRMPASLCGVAGLRPTMGRYPQRGIMLVSRTRDTIGPLARTVADVRLLDTVLSGADEDTGTVADALTGVRLGVVRHPFAEGLAPDLARIFERRLAELTACGADVVDVAFPAHAGDLIAKAGFPIAFHETTLDLPRYLEESGTGLSLAEVVERCGSADVRGILAGLLGDAAVAPADYREALTVHRPALDAMVREVFAENGLTALVWPTTPLTAAPIGSEEVSLGGERVSAFLAYTRTTNLGSIVGWPGVSVPAGLDDAGLPIGFALDGLPGSDPALLRVAEACEHVFGPLPEPAGR
ncbi:indoleacetamide hydrolase [Actinoallomurus purpureus]|uniref:indoleacetamide hydrolase n=1 Tax=Actinoallomurus purpureus TaxID=478114 RepID=UPI002092F7CD|nr:indoleacetamide hydrolase [Actinoallomurus purpureus]MCO6009885.1 indoleacetamide hydrolase [Actinoallomurus purpureus]